MNGKYLFSELTLDSTPLSDCLLSYESSDNQIRLYIKKKNNSFHFIAIGWAFCIDEPFDCDETRVDQLFEGVAYFDGVRHIGFNREEEGLEGYIYCPNIQAMSDMFQIIRNIEVELCYDCDGVKQ